MKKYSKPIKQQALEMIVTEGTRKTSELLNIPLTTIYRWKTSMQQIEATEETMAEETIDIVENEIEDTSMQDIGTDDHELDTISLLMAENEKLRKLTIQLKKALTALIE